MDTIIKKRKMFKISLLIIFSIFSILLLISCSNNEPNISLKLANHISNFKTIDNRLLYKNDDVVSVQILKNNNYRDTVLEFDQIKRLNPNIYSSIISDINKLYFYNYNISTYFNSEKVNIKDIDICLFVTFENGDSMIFSKTKTFISGVFKNDLGFQVKEINYNSLGSTFENFISKLELSNDEIIYDKYYNNILLSDKISSIIISKKNLKNNILTTKKITNQDSIDEFLNRFKKIVFQKQIKNKTYFTNYSIDIIYNSNPIVKTMINSNFVVSNNKKYNLVCNVFIFENLCKKYLL